MFAVTILGNNSAVPAFDRHPTSQVVTHDGNNYLVDCGEGTQIQMINYKIRRGKISHVFISHLHGDHYFGLVGLINSFGLLNHTQDLHVFGPSPLKEIIEMQLKVADTRLPYNLFLHTITEPATLLDTENLSVKCFRTNHRIECYGFVFAEKKPPRRLERENGRRYAFLADTKYDESIIPHIEGADMIYHETTYLDNLRERAETRFHSTSKQAAAFAKKAGVKKLLIGHFSSKYDTLEEFEMEAREIFPNTELALEGVAFNV